jgi:5-methylcytosine-specific restriction endonuclease McrA
MDQTTCTLAHCDRAAHEGPLCVWHKAQVRGGTELGYEAKERQCIGCGGPVSRPGTRGNWPTRCSPQCGHPCPIPGCAAPRRTGGYCQRHYMMVFNGKDPYLDKPRSCRYDGCPEVLPALPVKGRGRPRTLCDQHRDELYRANSALKAHRRRMKKEAAGTEKFSIEQVRRRDGDACAWCNEAIDFDLAYPHPMYPTMDHVLALANSGAHTLANVQLMHKRCNSAKGARYDRPGVLHAG